MSADNLQEYVFVSRYSRYNPALRRRETFGEAVQRVLDMHRAHFARKGLVVEDLLREVGLAMSQRQVLGSQRALQFGGEPILTKNARMYNCTTSYCDRPRFFPEALWLLLCGCGVGFSVQWHHSAKLPDIAAPNDGVTRFVIPDSIEGWADALGVLVSSYFVADQPFPEFFGKLVEFDYRLIRPKGSLIASGTGKAPGPGPLKRSLELIRAHLDRTLANGLTRLRPIDAYDLVMHASDAVLSGGVRRSATICLFSPDDQEMAQAKTGNWFVENPQRARSNNSALLLREGTAKEQFLQLMQAVREFGEPGFVWADDKDITYNPCVEIGLFPQLDGVSGWAFCNLCEINIGMVDSEEKFIQAARAAAILGTLQADYTSFDYLGEVSEKIARREALLGVSMTGMMEHPEIGFDPELQRRMAQLILEVNQEVASRIGLNPAARATCIKPAGSTSCILGTSSGIHPHHARRYFRRAQANEDEAIVSFFRESNPLAVEKSVWNPNGTGVVITFCIEAGQEAMIRKELSPVDLLAYVKLTKANWIDAGRMEERCIRPFLSHNVSNTITVSEGQWDEVADFIYDNRHYFSGISLLPDGGDLDYPQAPFCEVLSAEDIVKLYGVGAIMASGLIVDGMHAFDDNLWEACDAALGRGQDIAAMLDPNLPTRVQEAVGQVVFARKDWVRRAHKFARNYFGGNTLRMTRCLKRVHNCKLWEDLQRQYVKVDYTQLIEEEDNTVLEETIACGGGACEIL
jgi:ribonucleoside-diphosphate reductase alpha chain